MPYSGGGVFTLTPGYTATTGQTILPSQHNPPLEDIAAGLNLAFIRDGRVSATGNFSMGGNRITNLMNGVDAGDAVTKSQLDLLASLRGYIYGLKLSVNAVDPTNDIDISAGTAATDSSPTFLMSLPSNFTKRIDASWAVGSGNGGLDSGAVSTSATYHLWLIQRSDTGVVDVLFSLSSTSPTMPANYDRKRRIGSILREFGAIVRFEQIGRDRFRRAEIIFRDTNVGTSSSLVAVPVPTGITVRPIIRSNLYLTTGNSNVVNYVGSAQDGSAITSFQQLVTSTNAVYGISIVDEVTTDLSARIYFMAEIQAGNINQKRQVCLGWIDDNL